MSDFRKLNVNANVIKGMKDMRILEPSDVQTSTLGILLKDRTDITVQSQTGTGKTLAFAIPVLDRVDPNNTNIQALILCPTRELGQQIAKQIFKLTKYTEKIFVESVYGGAPIQIQISRLKRPTQILVATPGRLIELLSKEALDIDHVKTVVIDEADEMLKKGFNEQLDEIFKYSKQKSETWLFSATMPLGVKEMIKRYLEKGSPKIHVNKKAKVNVDIVHQYLVVPKRMKLVALKKFLQYNKNNRGIIFCKTKKDAQTLFVNLSEDGVKGVGVLHGDGLQKDRDKILRSIKNGRINFLITTDIMARGIDIDDLSFVLHYNLARDIEMYTHRSGRTARGGKEGLSLTFIEKEEHKRILYIGNNLGIKISKY